MGTYHFDAERMRDRLIKGIQKAAEEQHFSRAVLGISGGKDSTVTAALLARALGPENVYGIMLPDGEQKDLSDSIEVCKALGIRHRIINIGAMHTALKEVTDQLGACEAEGEFSIPYSRASDINVGPRLRMTTLRYAAQALDARLAGTGNLSELTVGYCTKDGDTSSDFAVLAALTSVEVVAIGLTMEELPRFLVEKTPTDGLSGKSDEDNLGLRYSDIHAYIRYGSCGNEEIDRKIAAKEQANMHKRRMPYLIDPWAEEEVES